MNVGAVVGSSHVANEQHQPGRTCDLIRFLVKGEELRDIRAAFPAAFLFLFLVISNMMGFALANVLHI